LALQNILCCPILQMCICGLYVKISLNPVIFTLHKHYTFLYMNGITFEVHLHVFPTQLKYVITTASEISYEKEVILKTN